MNASGGSAPQEMDVVRLLRPVTTREGRMVAAHALCVILLVHEAGRSFEVEFAAEGGAMATVAACDIELVEDTQ